MDWVNIIGWCGTILFCVGLGLYVRIQIKKEESA